jgi:hypothetical protein
MTEQEWLTWKNPLRMIKSLRRKASDRKLRLFACGCCRQLWPFLRARACRAAVEQAERYADGQASKKSLTPVRAEARRATQVKDKFSSRAWAYDACLSVVKDGPAPEVARAVTQYASAALLTKGVDLQSARDAQAALLRDIFSPFRRLPLPLAWQTPQLVALAQAAYDQRELPAGTLDLARLAVLADALEESGCDQADLLAHLRGPGPHVRGCWAVDLILGKS